MDSLITHSVAGEGEPLLLLNGGLMTMAAWGEVASTLERDFKVIRCDFRGQFLSPGVPEPSFDAHAADAIAVLDALKVERAHLVGTSFGGFVGVHLAARHPERAASLVAMTITEALTEQMREGAAALLRASRSAAAGGDPAALRDLIVPSTFSDDYIRENAARFEAQRAAAAMLPPSYYSGVSGLLAALDDVDLRPLLPLVQCPTLVIGGEADRTFPVEHSRAVAAAVPGSQLIVMKGAPHGLVVERAAEVSAIVRDFLLKVRGASVNQ